MPERFVRQSTRDRVPRHALDTALPTPRVVLDDAAFDRGPIRLDQLADGDEAELVEAAERGQVRGRESRVEHVEVFRDGEREELPSSGSTRPLPGHRRAQPTTPSFVKSPKTIGALVIAVAQDLGVDVAYLPGLSMCRVADLYPGQAKTDAHDAFIIAETARTIPHTLRGITVAEQSIAELSMLCGFDDDLPAQITQTRNRLRGFLTQIHPALELSLIHI